MPQNNSEEKIESKAYDKLNKKHNRSKIEDGFKKNKVINEVLDKPTCMTLYGLINSHIISYVNGVVKAGKESVVFWAVDKDKKNIALKIYLVSTSNFKARDPYILGDPRFSRRKKGTRNLVYLWARKEFKNLLRCLNSGIPVVKPIHVTKNILALEFMGENGIPAKTLLESKVNHNDYDSCIDILTRLYQDAKLVHGDFSEYNMFKTANGLVLFDLGSAVDLRHPNSKNFLQRDINNITNFFVKRGHTVKNPSDIFDEITK